MLELNTGSAHSGIVGSCPMPKYAWHLLSHNVCAPSHFLGTSRSRNPTGKPPFDCSMHPARQPTIRTAPLTKHPLKFDHPHTGRAHCRNANYYHSRTVRARKAPPRRATLASAGDRASCWGVMGAGLRAQLRIGGSLES